MDLKEYLINHFCARDGIARFTTIPLNAFCLIKYESDIDIFVFKLVFFHLQFLCEGDFHISC